MRDPAVEVAAPRPEEEEDEAMKVAASGPEEEEAMEVAAPGPVEDEEAAPVEDEDEEVTLPETTPAGLRHGDGPARDVLTTLPAQFSCSTITDEEFAILMPTSGDITAERFMHLASLLLRFLQPPSLVERGMWSIERYLLILGCALEVPANNINKYMIAWTFMTHSVMAVEMFKRRTHLELFPEVNHRASVRSALLGQEPSGMFQWLLDFYKSFAQEGRINWTKEAMNFPEELIVLEAGNRLMKQCIACQKYYNTGCRLAKHWLTHLPPALILYRCSVCDVVFRRVWFSAWFQPQDGKETDRGSCRQAQPQDGKETD